MPLSITSVAPNNPPTGQVIGLTITGAQFQGSSGVMSVTVDGNAVPFIVQSDTVISCSSYPFTATGNHTLTVKSYAPDNATANFNLQYTAAANPPRITRIQPASGPLGTTVTLSGVGLANPTSVSIFGTACTVVSATDSTAVITLPAALGGTGNLPILYTNANGTATAIYSLASPPTITGVNPNSGSAGQAITLAGTALDTVFQATVGGRQAAITSQTPTSLVLVAPSGLVGAQQIRVTNALGSTTATFTYPTPVTPPSSQRNAWLTLAGKTLQLVDLDTGYAMTQLDLGYPDVRDVTNNRPDQDGIDDRTQYFGARVITANLTAFRGGTATIDDIVALFAPYMQPSARPVLHWTEWSTTRMDERTLTMRADAFSAPMPPMVKREFQLSWVSDDPVIRSATVQQTIAWAGSSSGGGRTYPLVFPRVYPVGGNAPIPGTILTKGDVGVYPWYRLYGPITAPRIRVTAPDLTYTQIAFLPGFIVPAGQYVDIDAKAKTATMGGVSVLSSLDWLNTQWPFVSPGVSYQLSLTGSSTSGVTQVVGYWRDGYLS